MILARGGSDVSPVVYIFREDDHNKIIVKYTQ